MMRNDGRVKDGSKAARRSMFDIPSLRRAAFYDEYLGALRPSGRSFGGKANSAAEVLMSARRPSQFSSNLGRKTFFSRCAFVKNYSHQMSERRTFNSDVEWSGLGAQS